MARQVRPLGLTHPRSVCESSVTATGIVYAAANTLRRRVVAKKKKQK